MAETEEETDDEKDLDADKDDRHPFVILAVFLVLDSLFLKLFDFARQVVPRVFLIVTHLTLHLFYVHPKLLN